jgi:hypothetical protein
MAAAQLAVLLGLVIASSSGGVKPDEGTEFDSAPPASRILPSTSTPTSSPTWRCPKGAYISGTSCAECPVGRFSNSSSTSDQMTGCILCPLGTFANRLGSTTCETFASGKLSSDDRSYSRDCQPGEYSNHSLSCVACELGK